MSSHRQYLPVIVAILTLVVAPAHAVTWDLATDFDTLSGNGHTVNGATWEYGYIDFLGDFQLLTNSISDYNAAGGGPNPAWVEPTYMPPVNGGPFYGVSRADLAVDPSISGWAVGQVGGHTPDVLEGQGLAVRWTAPAGGGTYDIIGSAWQAGDDPSPPTLPQDGDRRLHDLQLIKNGSNKATGDLLHHTPITARRGLVNPAGGSGVVEPNATPISDVSNPTTIRTRQSLAGGEQVLLRVGNLPANAPGFYNFNLNINDTLLNNTSWDLARDYSQDTESGSATGIGPDGAWSYGVIDFLGSFQAFDQVSTTGAVTIHGVPNWEVASGNPAVPILTKTPDGVNGLSYNGGTQTIIGDTPAGSVLTHTPGDVLLSPGKTTSYQWTAPRNMTINIEADLWKANLVEAAGPLRNHGYDIVHNGNVIVTGGILEPAQGGNSGDPTTVQVPSLTVTAGQTVELRVRPLADNTETFVGSHFRINEGTATPGVVGYVHSAALDLVNDFVGGIPQNNANGDWAYFAADDTTTSLEATNGNSLPPGPNTFGAGAGWADPSGVPSYTRGNHPWTTIKESILGHGPQKVVWTAPAEIDAGGVEITGFLEQIFEENRQMQLSVFKNDTDGLGTPEVSVNAPSAAAPESADFNSDGLVDGQDFLTWQRGNGLVGQTDNSNGDADLSGTVDGVDLDQWETEYGTAGGSGLTLLQTLVDLPTTQINISPGDTLTFIVGSSGNPGFDSASTFAAWDVIIREIALPQSLTSTVPEPTTAMLLLCGFLGSALGRRHRMV